MALSAQPGNAPLVDGILAVVGNEVVLYSDLMAKESQARQNGLVSNDSIRCYMMEDLLFEKLLVNQADIDSVVVEEERVEAELDRRIAYFVQQIGSEEKLEEFYGKSITEIRSEFRGQVRDQLLSQMMESKITSNIRITPKDVKRFYDNIPEDSLPFINAEVEYAEIVVEPKPSAMEERNVKLRLQKYRQQILDGEKDFCTLAVLYSADPGSARDCGELGMVPRGVMVPEFDAVALSMKDGDISHVFRTDFGYHLVQMIERRGDQYNARHILLQPTVSTSDIDSTRRELDKLVSRIRNGEVSFEEAVTKYSEDEDSRANSGMPVNPYSGSTKWEMGALDRQVFYVLDKLELGEVSDPGLTSEADGKKVFRIFKLVSESEPHKADVITDYLLIKRAAENKKKQELINDWVTNRTASTYIRVVPGYQTCPFNGPWKLLSHK
jgi:peptidyl-prolyl cis-trans isomerase SurA